MTPEKICETVSPASLSYDEAVDALEREEPEVTSLVTARIMYFSEQVAERLKDGSDYLDLLTPSKDTPVLEAIAMEIVREAVEEEMEEAD